MFDSLRAMKPASKLMAGAYAVIVGAALLLAGAYKSVGLADATWHSKGSVALALGAVLVVCGAAISWHAWTSGRTNAARDVQLALCLVVLSALGAVGASEILLRAVARFDPGGWRIGEVVVPRTWREQTERNREVISAATPSGTWREPLIVYDPILGWAPAPNRRSADGLYASSAEGVRSSVPGERQFDRRAPRRVALIGDSSAYSLEVSFEDSWARQLEHALGDGTQVVNFGVEGFGIDQTNLRYQRDVVDWKPDVVVMNVIQSDFVRTMGVYAFVTFPTWDLPFSKPRFDLVDGVLVKVNEELMPPETIAAAKSIHDLPNIVYDYGYNHSSWSWRPDWAPFTWRYFAAVFPRIVEAREQASSTRLIEVNATLLREIAQRVATNEGRFLLVYLPPIGTSVADESIAASVLARAGVPYLDMRACLEAMPAESVRVPSGHHFSPAANRAIARCTATALAAGNGVAD